MPFAPAKLSREAVDAIRADYADRSIAIAEICRRYGIGRTTLMRCAEGRLAHLGLVRPPLPRRGVARIREPDAEPDDRAGLIRSIWRTAQAQVRAIESRTLGGGQEPTERERDMRVLAVVARTLRELRAFDRNEDATGEAARAAATDDDPPPRDIDEFRRELARRIDALVASRTGGGGAGEPG